MHIGGVDLHVVGRYLVHCKRLCIPEQGPSNQSYIIPTALPPHSAPQPHRRAVLMQFRFDDGSTVCVRQRLLFCKAAAQYHIKDLGCLGCNLETRFQADAGEDAALQQKYLGLLSAAQAYQAQAEAQQVAAVNYIDQLQEANPPQFPTVFQHTGWSQHVQASAQRRTRTSCRVPPPSPCIRENLAKGGERTVQ